MHVPPACHGDCHLAGVWLRGGCSPSAPLIKTGSLNIRVQPPFPPSWSCGEGLGTPTLGIPLPAHLPRNLWGCSSWDHSDTPPHPPQTHTLVGENFPLPGTSLVQG